MGSALIVQRDGSVTKSEWLIIFVPEYAWLDIFVLKVSAIYYLALYECNSFIFVWLCCILYCCALLYFTLLYCTVLYCTVLYCTVLYCAVRTLVYCIVCPTIYLNSQLSLPDPFPVLSCLVLSCLVLSCLVLSCLLFCCLLSHGCLLGSISPTQMSCGDHSLYCPSGSSKPLHVGAGFYTVIRKHHRHFLRITTFHFHPFFISQWIHKCKP